jgi:hypothetical protein
MAKKKILGWGECVANDGTNAYDDLVEGSASLSVEEGDEQEANIEGGKAEGRKQSPDKYIIEYDRRLGDEEFKPGYIEDFGEIAIIPKNTGAVYAELKGVSLKKTLRQDTTDGLVGHYEYKTKGSTDSQGNLDDVEIKKSTLATSFTAVTETTGKNPYVEGWYTKVGNTDVYVHAFENAPKDGVTYYAIS